MIFNNIGKDSFLRLLPNLITLIRFALTPIIAAMMLFPSDTMRWITFSLYFIACVSDYFDGYLARAMKAQSPMGRMLDPIADKLLVAVILMMLVMIDQIGVWHIAPALIILSREIFVSGLREFLIEIRVSIPVTYLAKWKTTVQLLSLGFLMLADTGDKVLPGSQSIGYFLLWVSAAITVYTGWDYLKAGIKHLRDEPEDEA